ncbi:MAG: methyltransferase domain-containing protein [Chloroflexi bacterium]|nr:methyltransferase domain-containing protein [Chloroflexota bacterium]
MYRLTGESGIDLQRLAQVTARPARFTPHDAPFWDDPHIATQMLAFHLDPETDAASRRPATIERTVGWLTDALGLRGGARLLDLGCGPGLYCERFAERGVQVRGIDLSANSLAYARASAARRGLDIEYVHASYLTLDVCEEFDAATLIYFDLGVLSEADRDQVLRRVWRALRPGGRFAFDLKTPEQPRPPDGTSRWSVQQAGFWRPHPYLELAQTFWYAEHATELRQMTIVDPDGRLTTYRVWDQTYTAAQITEVLQQQGFEVVRLCADLLGSPASPETGTLGIVAQKPS